MTHPRLSVALRSLRDVPGVLGSFVWRRDGQVVASDVPPSCAPSTLAALAIRLQRMCEGFANVGDAFESTTLVFRDYKLHVCGVAWASVGIVVSNRVNMSALQLALQLSLRELAELANPERASRSTAEPSRSYRGQRLLP
jgi:predicted regulator of Ras-like GTPase activity (Roadblock/LC7/MglB family)